MWPITADCKQIWPSAAENPMTTRLDIHQLKVKWAFHSPASRWRFWADSWQDRNIFSINLHIYIHFYIYTIYHSFHPALQKNKTTKKHFSISNAILSILLANIDRADLNRIESTTFWKHYQSQRDPKQQLFHESTNLGSWALLVD